MTDKQLEEMARQFHDTYEELAPKYGYKTKEETRTFDHKSPNGRLMIAVCSKVAKQIQTETAREIAEEVKNTFPKIHTNASENSDRYHIQDETCELIATKIKTRYGLEG